jgi:O-antigen/teichoic acid export membrane protein
LSTIETLADRLIAALPLSRHVARLRNRLSTFADQAAQGLANLGVAALAARQLSREDFASIGVMLGAHFLMFGFHRAVVVLPYILDQHSPSTETGCWWRVNLLASAGVGVMLALAAAVLYLWPGQTGLTWVARGLACAAWVSPLLCTADFARRRLYQALHATTAAVSAGLYALLSFSWIMLLPLLIGRHDVWSASGAWAIGAAASAGLSFAMRPARRGSWREALDHWRPFKGFSAWQAATHVPYTLYNNSAVLLIGALAGPLAASAFTASRTLATPASSLVTAVDSLDKPRAARALKSDGLPGLRRSIGRTRVLLIALTGGYLALIALTAPAVLHLMFGDKYATEATATRILCGVFFLIGLNQPSETLLIVLRASRMLFATRMIAAVAAIAGIGWGARVGGLDGACWALALTQVLNLVLLRIAERQAARAYKATAAAPLEA